MYWSSAVGGRSSTAQRTLFITLRVAQNTPTTNAVARYTGTTMNEIQATSGANTLGIGNATVITSVATPIPIRFATTTKVVRMIWIRTRRRRWLSETRPRIHDPYSGVDATRGLWLVTRSNTRPRRCAAVLLPVMVASA